MSDPNTTLPLVQAYKEIDRLKAENTTLRNAQKACEDCDAPTLAQTNRLKAQNARLEAALRSVLALTVSDGASKIVKVTAAAEQCLKARTEGKV